ncbi:efflux RND transporter periplasmic adaptor subunit [Ferrovibrio sp.]|uniref:efflux RND transporter periplasmic adaptor subunit n=1 Tax=Ferrovibrio sp. TaxID=1917215 RepID=UPI0026167404|nr:efflux RND transporter periplasmic adaptor subunit [Ferrovibrio sp.]
MTRLAKIGLSVLALAIMASGGLYLLKGRQPVKAISTAEPARFEGIEFSPADLAEAKIADLRQVVRLSGTLQPLNQSLVRAEVAAVVQDISVRRGESVKKGQLLARLDTADLNARLREKQSNLDSARSALNLAQINRDKAITLTQRGVKSQTALDEAENAWRNARANVAALEQQVTMARKAQGDAAIYAPLDGLVAERYVNPGERVAVDAKLFVIADLDVLEVEALVPARDVPQLKIGQKVLLNVEGFADRPFEGHVERINPTAQSGSRSIPVYVLLKNPEHVLRGGMFGSGEAVLAERRGAVAIPVEALRRDNNNADIVYVLKDSRLERRAVSVALAGTPDGRVAISSGVAAGETVVATPGLRLSDGLPARIAGR